MGKTYTAKSPPSDFKVTTPENPLLPEQVVTSKGILVPYTNLQLNPYPCFVVTNSHFNERLLVRDLITNLRRMLDAKFFSLSHDEEQEAL